MFKCLAKVNPASPNSKFADGTWVCTNLGGTMPVHIKEDGTKSSVFPVNGAILASTGIKEEGEYLLTFKRDDKPTTYTKSNGEVVTEKQMRIVSAKLLDAIQFDDLSDKQRYQTVQYVGSNLAEYEESTSKVTSSDETAMP